MIPRREPVVLHVITRLIVGGAQLTVLETCKGLRDQFAFQVACGPQEGREGTIRHRFDGIAPVTLIPELRREISPLHDYRAIGALRRAMREIRPDLVHTHSSKAGILARHAAAAERIPAVHTVHGWGHTPSDSRARREAFIRLERWAAKRCRTLIAVSRDVREEGLAHRIGGPAQYMIIPECVDYRPLNDQFLEARASARQALGLNGLPGGASVVGWVGRFVPQKDPVTLVGALGRVLTASPETRAVLVGDGPLREDVRRGLEGLGVSERVVWAGLRPDARALFAAFDVVVHPSLWEGQPRVVQEAIAERIPVVATEASGIEEIVEDGALGFVVRRGDVEAVADRTLAVLRSEVPTPLPESKIASLRRRHGRDVALRRHRALYADILG
jgi:glycosyltransferase involved in cell wall biosynthesis